MQASTTTGAVEPQSVVPKTGNLHRSAGIWLLWLAIMVSGYLLSAALSILLVSQAPDTPGMLGLNFLAIVVSQIIIGLLQWLVLRRYIRGMKWVGWVLATLFSHFIANLIVLIVMIGPIIFGIGETWPETLGVTTYQTTIRLLSGALHGAVIGLLQGLVLQRYLRPALWWLPANIIGWAVSGAALLVDARDFGVSGPSVLLIEKGIAGAVLGIVTGAALAWILRQSEQEVNAEGTNVTDPDQLPSEPANRLIKQTRICATDAPRRHPHDIDLP